MDEEEQEVRMISMQSSLKKYDIFQWVKVFMDRLKFVKEKQADLESKALDKKIINQMKVAFKTAKKPLLLLDYDGTLVGFKGRPQDAFPDEEYWWRPLQNNARLS